MAFGDQFLSSARLRRAPIQKPMQRPRIKLADSLANKNVPQAQDMNLSTGYQRGMGGEPITGQGSANAAQTLSQPAAPKAADMNLSGGYGRTTPSQPAQQAQPQVPGIDSAGITEGLVGQGVDIYKQGQQFLNQGSAEGSQLAGLGNQLAGQGQDFTGQMNQQATASQDPRLGTNLQNLLNQQEAQAKQDVSNYFDYGDPAQQARANIGQSAVDAAQTGMTGSRSANQVTANIERGLLRDKFNALLSVGQQARQNVLGQLDQTRAGNLNLAGLYGGLGQGYSSLGANALGTAGGLQQGMYGLGANLANQGFQNQIAGINTGANLGQRGFENEINLFNLMNNLNQKRLENTQGNKQNKFTKQQIQKQMELMAQMGGGGGLGGILGGALGGAGAGAALGPWGALGGAVLGGVGGAF